METGNILPLVVMGENRRGIEWTTLHGHRTKTWFSCWERRELELREMLDFDASPTRLIEPYDPVRVEPHDDGEPGMLMEEESL